ncbi:hypothetical protein GCM10009727_79870 [Actinomadura napierensis]|uniref:Uncharacterized protein n=1 Tax=Actinomadura napierensis TaxID=267854 RepID=A0ABN3AED3_9ACTN
MRTERAGHDTDPIAAETGCGVPLLGGALVGVFDGLRVVEPEGEGEDEEPVPDVLGLGDAEVVEEARAPEPDDFVRAGMAISAPMTRNTAAMTTLGNCIAVLLTRGGRRAGGRVIRDHSQPRRLWCRYPHR